MAKSAKVSRMTPKATDSNPSLTYWEDMTDVDEGRSMLFDHAVKMSFEDVELQRKT